MNVFPNENVKLHKNDILLLMINFQDNKTAHMTLTHNNHYSEDSLKNPKAIYDRKSTYKICFTIICRKRRTNFFNLIWCGDRNIYFSLKICVFFMG